MKIAHLHSHPCVECSDNVPCYGGNCGTIYQPVTELTCSDCESEEEERDDARTD